jgi:hypothetical protein
LRGKADDNGGNVYAGRTRRVFPSESAESEVEMAKTMKTNVSRCWLAAIYCGLSLVSLVASTGCQTTSGGQVLPSPYYISDDVQYFAPGPEFKLSREAAAQKAYKAEAELRR